MASWFFSDVYIPACQPVSEIVLYPNSFSNILNFAIDTCSPVLRSTSNSLSFGILDNSLDSVIKWSVVFPWADTTTTIFFFWL